jgi:superfamily II DNA or RNA helicase
VHKIIYSYDDIIDQFPHKYVLRGQEYALAGKVTHVGVSDDGCQIVAEVKGRSLSPYLVEIELDNENSRTTNIDGECSCPVLFNCKHVVATLFHAISSNQAKKPVPKLSQPSKQKEWLSDLKATLENDQVTQTKVTIANDESIVYILEIVLSRDVPGLKVLPQVARHLKKGGLGKPRKFNSTALSHIRLMQEIDKTIISRLDWLSTTSYPGYSVNLRDTGADKVISMLLETKRCFWKSCENEQPLVLGGPRPLNTEWIMQQDGYQSFIYHLNDVGASTLLLRAEQFWYLNTETNTCGLIESALPVETVYSLAKMSALPPGEAHATKKYLAKQFPGYPSLLPKILKKVTSTSKTPLEVELRLLAMVVELPFGYGVERIAVAELAFNYGDTRVLHTDTRPSISQVKGDVIEVIKRDKVAERKAIKILEEEIKLEKGDVLFPYEVQGLDDLWYIADLEAISVLADFSFRVVPHLESKGWKVTLADNYPSKFLSEEEAEWYSELDESDYDWFGLDFGVMVGDKKISIVDTISGILRDPTFSVDNLNEASTILVSLPDKTVLEISSDRLKGILSVLTELYDKDHIDDEGKLRLSRLRASSLEEFGKAVDAANLRWIGGERLRQLGKRLSNFKEIEASHVPKRFCGSLRAYQQTGVDWLQFLREYELAGVLADDMGLGKTVQALAHLLIEYDSGRMTTPSLIIAPTSLMLNWELETKRFTPELKVLTLHGSNRRELFPLISKHQIILTTYPLLVRDKAVLLEQNFYYLILDEAQVIKNPKSKTTHIVQQLHAKHRLCLTGTPMENHLGELWSLFNFLMPGFLGHAENFRHFFKNPIEKHDDRQRRKSLALRVKPFLLRRKKDDVVTELPKKNIIIRTVELEDAQRDLYESIRLTMQKKVKRAIQAKGVGRSHIIILDALLKLRQTCCDPRLLKIDAAKRAHKHSAKLTLLMELLPNLIAEGRRILLFSQFTSMLDLIKKSVEAQGIEYVTLVGSTKDRATPIKRFQDKQVPLFLISLKAGGVGLNLTAADTVIHYDPWWNPAVENQATDRAHRIGQEKQVNVYKLITKGTVEETILQMQEKKSALIEGLFNDQGGSGKLSAGDLQQLFQPIDTSRNVQKRLIEASDQSEEAIRA